MYSGTYKDCVLKQKQLEQEESDKEDLNEDKELELGGEKESSGEEELSGEKESSREKELSGEKESSREEPDKQPKKRSGNSSR